MSPQVSIIMNCHNGEKFLYSSLDSIMKQSYKNWELIFWDNNSSDNSKNLCKKFKDKRIKYFYSKNYYKLYKSRNLALQKAKGKFITFLDTDDLWYKNKIKDQIKFLLKNNFKICYSNYLMFNESKRKKKFNEKYEIIGDFDFFINLSFNHKIGFLNKTLAIYRVHNSNLSLKGIDLHIKELKNWIKKNHLFLARKKLNVTKQKNYLIKLGFKKLINYYKYL